MTGVIFGVEFMMSFRPSGLASIRMKYVTMEEGGIEAVIRIVGRMGGTDGEYKIRQRGTTFINKKVPKVFLWDLHQCNGTVKSFKYIKKYMEVSCIM